MSDERIPLPLLSPWTWKDVVACVAIAVLAVLISLPGLHARGIDGLDAAHHLMDGYFFRDLMVDHPVRGIGRYVLQYYKQYPALGFLFWPPLFPAVLGCFDLVFGAHVLTARLCVLAFGVLFGVCLYALLRRSFGVLLAWTAVCAAMTLPGIVRSFNEVMLELPTLAVMMAATLLYQRMMERRETRGTLRRAVLCGTACAAVVYTKQPGWFLYGALLFDLGMRHGDAWKDRSVRLAGAVLVVLCVPLLLFTLKFGHANLAQSVGQNTRLIMRGYDALPRWSVAAWSYYPRLALSQTNVVVVMLTVGAMVLGVVRRAFVRAYALWFAWLLLGYVTFSFYDNRLPRHATFWWPAWVVLAAALLHQIRGRWKSRWNWTAALVLLLPVPMQVRASRQQVYGDFQGEREAVDRMLRDGGSGNVLLFGKDKQMFIALLREADEARVLHAVRGEPLLEHGMTPAQMCFAYRAGTVVIEAAQRDPSEAMRAVQAMADATPALRRVDRVVILRNGLPWTVDVYRYDGVMADVMGDVLLSDRLL